MRVLATVQARFSSHRLPGKVLRPMLGRPMLSHLIEALQHSRSIDDIVIATSDHVSDDALEAFAREHRINCFRGSLDNVAARLLGAARQRGTAGFVRINGDSPLLDPALIDHGVDLFRENEVDVVCNVFPRSFPKGQSVEVIRADSLERVLAGPTTNDEREHVTQHFYAHPERFSIRAFVAPRPRPELQLSVDTLDDFAMCEDILRALGEPPWSAGWERCAAAADAIAAARTSVHSV